MPITIEPDPPLPAAAPADPEAASMPGRVSKAAVPLRSSAITATMNRFLARVQTHLQRLADRETTVGIAMEQPIDMNGHKIINVARSYQLNSLVPREHAREVLGVDDD